VDLLALGSKPGQRKRLELPQVFEFGVLADDALGEFGAAGLQPGALVLAAVEGLPGLALTGELLLELGFEVGQLR
jgi:hypothetical protein